MNIVMAPFHDYKKWQKEGFRTRDAHICEHFDNNQRINKILVINRPTSLAEVVFKGTGWGTPEGEIEYKKKNTRLSKMKDKVWCLDILLYDFVKVVMQKKMWWFTAFNYASVIEAVNYAITFLDMKDSVLLLQNPMAIGIANQLKCSKFVFDAIDNWIYHPQMPDKELICKNYEYVDRHADLIMTVSKALTDTFPENSNVHWVPNGVDVEYFSSAIRNSREKRKIIGYVGKIQDRVDFELVETCLKLFSDEKFVFLGPVYSQKENVRRLQRVYKNIEFKGDIHYTKLPDEIKDFDIAIIPHKVDRFTESMNPLKLYEYLAAGKPVVTTGIAGVSSISQYVYIAENKEQFVKMLSNLITMKEGISSRMIVDSIPDECKWETRTSKMLDLIDEL